MERVIFFASICKITKNRYWYLQLLSSTGSRHGHKNSLFTFRVCMMMMDIENEEKVLIASLNSLYHPPGSPFGL